MRILFWGTPDFATPPLRALIGEGFEVIGVVTQPDKPVGRHRSTVAAPPVKTIALDEGLPVFQPESMKDPEFLDMLTTMAPDLSVVVAYGKLLPQRLIDLPAQGTLNIHASLLPQLRGAAPIQAAIRDGLAETGVSVVRMVLKLDAGPVLLRSTTPVLEDETYGELALRLSELGALALLEALTLLSVGRIEEQAQDESMATYAPKVDREMARVDWRDDCDTVSRAVRAYDPRPGAFTTLGGIPVKLYGARPIHSARGEPGTVLDVDEHGMLVACREGGVRIGYAHPAGKRRLAALDWAQGRGIRAGDRFGTTEQSPP
jgi:methionyl-tRNA formyltransferase